MTFLDDILIHLPNEHIFIYIAEGNGSNLLMEDMERGMVDYLMYYIYDETTLIEDIVEGKVDEEDGGQILFDYLIQEKFNDLTETIPNVLDFITDGNGNKIEYKIVIQKGSDIMFCVIMYHSFDADTPVYVFPTYEKAKKFFDRTYENYLNEEIANNSELDMDNCFHEDEFAKVTWSDGESTEFILSCTSEPEDEYYD